MKDAKTYERKVKKLLPAAKKLSGTLSMPDGMDVTRYVVYAVLLADATERQAQLAMGRLDREFVDLNEVRVCQVKELGETLGRDHPRSEAKAQIITDALNGVFRHRSAIKMDYVAEMNKRDIRRHFREIGLCEFSEAMVSMVCYDVHAVAVDTTLNETLEMLEMVSPGSAIDDTQKFLERIIPQKNGHGAHVFLREFVEKHAKALAKKRADDEKRRLAEEEAARKAAEEAERLAREEAERQAAEAAARAETKRLAEEEKARKKAEREAARVAKAAEAKKAKVAKKKAKVAERKAAKVAKKSAAKKTARTKAVKKAADGKVAAKKPVKKTAKKAAKKASRKAVAKKSRASK